MRAEAEMTYLVPLLMPFTPEEPAVPFFDSTSLPPDSYTMSHLAVKVNSGESLYSVSV